MNDKFIGQDAKRLLDDPAHKLAVKGLNEYIENKAMNVDPNDQKAAQIIILMKQLAKEYITQLERLIQNGQVEEIKLSKLEKKKTIFNRNSF